MTNVGDVYELAVLTTPANGTNCWNVFHFRQKAGFLSAINLVGEWRTNIEAQYRGMLSSAVNVVYYTCRSLIPLNADSYATAVSPAQPGTRGVSPCPPLSCAVITWRTAKIGRSRRGRSYLSGIAINDQTGGTMVSTWLTNYAANFGNQFLSRWAPGGLSGTTEAGVWSRKIAGPTAPFDPTAFEPITAFTAQVSMGSMGTRRVGRGA